MKLRFGIAIGGHSGDGSNGPNQPTTPKLEPAAAEIGHAGQRLQERLPVSFTVPLEGATRHKMPAFSSSSRLANTSRQVSRSASNPRRRTANLAYSSRPKPSEPVAAGSKQLAGKRAMKAATGGAVAAGRSPVTRGRTSTSRRTARAASTEPTRGSTRSVKSRGMKPTKAGVESRQGAAASQKLAAAQPKARKERSTPRRPSTYSVSGIPSVEEITRDLASSGMDLSGISSMVEDRTNGRRRLNTPGANSSPPAVARRRKRGGGSTRSSSIPRRRPATAAAAAPVTPHAPQARSPATRAAAAGRGRPSPARGRRPKGTAQSSERRDAPATKRQDSGRQRPALGPIKSPRSNGSSPSPRPSPPGAVARVRRQRRADSPSRIPQYAPGGKSSASRASISSRTAGPQRPRQRPQTAQVPASSAVGADIGRRRRGPSAGPVKAFPFRRDGKTRGDAPRGGGGGAASSNGDRGDMLAVRGRRHDALTPSSGARPATSSDGSTPSCFVCGAAIAPGGAYVECPNGTVRHRGCPVPCEQCGRATLQPRYFTGIHGAFCSEDCGARADPAALRCVVCNDVIVGHFSKSPDGDPRHNGCAISCTSCGRRTTRPKYFRDIRGAFCSETCSARADPRAIRCCECGDVIIGKYMVVKSGKRAGQPLHNACA